MEGPGEVVLRRGPVGEDGAHAFAYNTRTPGRHSISATIGGVHVRGSPADVTASIAPPHAPLCAVLGPPQLSCAGLPVRSPGPMHASVGDEPVLYRSSYTCPEAWRSVHALLG